MQQILDQLQQLGEKYKKEVNDLQPKIKDVESIISGLSGQIPEEAFADITRAMAKAKKGDFTGVENIKKSYGRKN